MPIYTPKADIISNPNKKLTTLSYLGSTEEVEKSALGVDGVENGTISYKDVEFGVGVDLTVAGSYIQYNNILNLSKGCICFYWMPNFVSTAGHGAWLFRTINVAGHFGMYWNTLYGSPRPALRFGIMDANDKNTNVFTFNAGDVFHIAYVWNKDGINGTSNTIQVYKDGINISPAYTTSISGVTADDVPLGGNGSTGAGNASFSNLRIYNYDKTDFKDILTKYPQKINGTNICTTPLKQVVIHNTLGSTAETEDSEIGIDGVENGSVSYTSCKFNNGVQLLLSSEYVKFDGFNIQPDNGWTIDFYFILSSTSTNTRYNLMDRTVYGSFVLSYDIRTTTNNQLTLTFTPDYPTNTRQVAFRKTISAVSKDTPHHMRIIIDPSEASNGDKIQAYIDGTMVTDGTTAWDSTTVADWTNMKALTELLVGGAGAVGLDGDRIIENLIVYNWVNKNFKNIEVQDIVDLQKVVTE